LAPVITIILSLWIYQRVPYDYQIIAMCMTAVAIYLMAKES